MSLDILQVVKSPSANHQVPSVKMSEVVENKPSFFKKYWTNRSPNFRRFWIGYTVVSFGCYSVYNYNDGKNSLIDHREMHGETTGPTREWYAIKQGINSCDNLFDAIFFPISVFNKTMPSFILLTNPRSKKSWD